MIKYVALLRGIGPANPNMRNDKLRVVFERLGLTNVQTVISSGNVLFETNMRDIAKLESMIEKALPEYLGFYSTTIIRSLKQLQELASQTPFNNMEHSSQHYLTVTFFKHTPHFKSEITMPYQPPNKGYELLSMYKAALFSVVNLTNAKTPDLMSWLEKEFGKGITTRTWKTVQKIIKKLDPELG